MSCWIDIYEGPEEPPMSAAEEFARDAVNGVVQANSVARHFIQRNLNLVEALRQIELGALTMDDAMFPESVRRFAREFRRIATDAIVKDQAYGR